MQCLDLPLHSRKENITIHNIILDKTEIKLLNIKNEFYNLFDDIGEMNNLSVKLSLKK